MKKITNLVLTFLLVSIASAQNTPAKKIALEASDSRMHLNYATGINIVDSGKNISGYNPDSDTPLWTIDKKSLLYSNISNELRKITSNLTLSGLASYSSEKISFADLPNSFLTEVTFGSSYALINASNGDVLFGSKKDKVDIIEHYFVPENNSIVYIFQNITETGGDVVNITDSAVRVGKFDILSNSKVWVTELFKTDQMLSILSGFNSKDITKINPSIDKDGNLFLFYKQFLGRIAGADGKITWSNRIKELGINDFYITNNEKYLIQLSKAKGFGGMLGTKVNMMALDANTGINLWKEPFKIDNPLYFKDLEDTFVLASSKGFNIYNTATGEKQWKKAAKGDTKSVIPTEGGYIFVEGKNMQMIGNDGKELWKNEVEISDNEEDQVILLEEKDNKIIYATSTYSNIVDKKTGKKIWNKNLKLNEKRSTFSVYDENKSEYIIYSDEKIYKFNINSNERPEALTELKIRYEKEINNFEITEKGYLISGEREFALIGFDGKLIAQNKYKEAGNRRLVKSLLIGGSIASAFLGSSIQATDTQGNVVAEGGIFVASKQSRKAISASSVAMSAAVAKFTKRPNTSKMTSKSLFFFTDESSEQSRVLVEINKDSGLEVARYKFNNAKPVYEVDDVAGVIYYINDKNLEIFKK